MRSSIALVIAYLLLGAGAATATSPIPPTEETVGTGDMDLGYMRDGILDKQDEIPERCLPRNLLCAGPFDPDVDAGWGATGVRIVSNDTNLTVGHDPSLHRAYGPFRIPLLVDDLMLCYSRCIIPASLYARLDVNVTVIAYVGDADGYQVVQYRTSQEIRPITPHNG